MNPKLERSLPIAFSIMSAIGVVVTSVLVAKSTLKHKDEIEEVIASKSKKQIAKTIIKSYKLPIAIGTATIASMVTSTIISKKIEASLSATAIMLDQTYRKYKGKVKEMLGDETDKKVVESISKDDYEEKKPETPKEPNEILYWEEHIGFFKAKREDLKRGLAITNEKILTSYNGTEKIVTDHWASIETFIDDCKITLFNHEDIDDVSFEYGWSSEYMYEVYGDDSFLHIKEIPQFDENGVVKYIIIQFDKEPVFNVIGSYDEWEFRRSQYNAKDCHDDYTY